MAKAVAIRRSAKDPERVAVPTCYATAQAIDRNRTRQILVAEDLGSLELNGGRPYLKLADGLTVPLVKSAGELSANQRGLRPKKPFVLRHTVGTRDLDELRWVGDITLTDPGAVLASLDKAFSFAEENLKSGEKGLRRPQIGAIHAVLGQWTTGSFDPATVVMPTGTGKTETMLGLFAAARPSRLLVIVPSDALRDQIAEKFESFGVLQELGVLKNSAIRPVIGRIEHGFANAKNATTFAKGCNVIVATPPSLMASPEGVRRALLSECTHLFVDEAHHVAASTWKQVRDEFKDKHVVQLTATPFREDGRRLGGKLIYVFPLKQAQSQGFFSQINYHAIVDFETQDRSIATKAIEVLRADLKKGLDHLLMARVGKISRADEVIAIYKELAPDLNPIALHSRLGAKERKDALASLRSRKSKIVVCVDMLGEGFDLPSLKVAAIHDPHRSLGVTLQFVGRFARVSPVKIGEASVVVAHPESDYDDNLRRLYSEDADWNKIIRNLSEEAVGQEEEISQFESEFNEIPEEIGLANLLPKMSTVVYRTKCDDWTPNGIMSVFPEEALLTFPISVNAKEHVAWFVTEITAPVQWGDSQTVQDQTHDLYVLYWDEEKKLLYINSSNNESVHESLAKAVCDDDVALIEGEKIYRTMANIDRLVPTNMGVLDYRNRSRRFSMHVGADVGEAFPTVEAQTKTKTNIFAYGFESGNRVSVGAALKGRVWSHKAATSVKSWMDWCDDVGAKLTDESVSIDELMKHFIRPKALTERPPLVALALEWPYEVFLNTSDEVRVKIGEASWPLVDADLEIIDLGSSGPIKFRVATPSGKSNYEIAITEKGLIYSAAGVEADVVYRETVTPLSAWLDRHGLTIHLEQDATIMPRGLLLKPDRELPPFDLNQLRVLDWAGTNIQKESQGTTKASDSVQARVIEHVLADPSWDVVIDDDGSGELADVVALRATDSDLHVLLVHCKASSAPAPGHRVEDLYELCGQAQKSARWKRGVDAFFTNLIRRERKRAAQKGRKGFEKGDAATLTALRDRSRLLSPNFSISVAQPGLSKAEVTKPQLELLASTEVYVHETALAPFEVLCNG